MGLNKIVATLKSGQERLINGENQLPYALLDFWRWSVSDILSNATRGRFAEFIVATATNIDITKPRDEWSAYDLETPEGIKLEVKSAAYLQSWYQDALSKISFGISAAKFWDSATNKFAAESMRHADVYVFCLLHHDNKQTVDPLNLDQWAFYVLATKQLNEYTRSRQTVTLRSLQKLTQPVNYDMLGTEIKDKQILNVL